MIWRKVSAPWLSGRFRSSRTSEGVFHLQAGESVRKPRYAVHMDLGLAFHQTQAYQIRVSGVVLNQ